MMEIGSFIELQFPAGKEYYSGGDLEIARLNSGRAAIWHAFRLTGCEKIWLPYYQCETVREFLSRKQVDIGYYHIDNTFAPTDLHPGEKDAVLLVNYFGMMSRERMQQLAKPYSHVILDNSQAFFCSPIPGCLNVYSCRKFIGVPDGAYVIGENAENFLTQYPQGFSSDTSLFLLQRLEYGCEGKTYASRTCNEERIDTEDIMRMSKLTHTILDGTDYEQIRAKRKENFRIAHALFGERNCLDPMAYYREDCVPMVYPLLVENENLLPTLLQNKHFQGHWWKYITEELDETCFEHYVSRYMVPITIDQRYGREELTAISGYIAEI